MCILGECQGWINERKVSSDCAAYLQPELTKLHASQPAISEQVTQVLQVVDAVESAALIDM